MCKIFCAYAALHRTLFRIKLSDLPKPGFKNEHLFLIPAKKLDRTCIFAGMIPGVLVISLVTSLMIVYMTDVNGFGIFFVTTFLVLMNAESFMYMVSTFTDEHVTATAMAAAFFGTFMICCGFLLQRSVSDTP